MPASIQFTNTAEVSVGNFKKIESVDFYVANSSGIKIYQRCEEFYKNTIFHIKIVNTCSKQILNLRFADYICTSTSYSVQRIIMSKGCYHFISNGVCFHIESLDPNETIYLRLVLFSRIPNTISNTIGLRD